MDGPQHVQELSARKRYMLFGMACTHVLLASGEAYGWTALRPVLLNSGIFDGSATPAEQASKMNSVATMGIAANALCKFPLGLLLDRCGPRATSVVGSLIMITGCIIMALAEKNDQYMLMLGYFCLGCAGPFLQMPCFQFSELFGHRKASAMAYLITCFELSTGVFWIFGELNANFGLDRKQLFFGYAGVGLYALVTGICFWPDLPYRAPPPQMVRNMAGPSPRTAGRVNRPAVVAKPLLDKPLLTQICSTPFVYVVCFLTLHIFRQGFLLATLGPQVEYFFPDATIAEKLKTSFNIILPLGFIPMMLCTASGFAAYILDRPRLAFVVVTLLSMGYGLLLLVPEQWSFLILFVIFPVARQFVFSTFFSFSANTFGYASFGRIAGVASTVAGLVQLTQTKLVQIATDPNNSLGLNWEKVDLILGTVPVLLFIYPVASWTSQMLSQKDEKKDAGYESVNDDESSTAPLMGAGGRNSDTDQMYLDDEDEDDMGRITMSYVEATSYGSHSASSFAALYTQYMEDVKVSVVPVADEEDRSIHVGTLPGSLGEGRGPTWPSATMQDVEAARGYRD